MFDRLRDKLIKRKSIVDLEAEDPFVGVYLKDLYTDLLDILDEVWHDSNVEQPDGKRVVVVYNGLFGGVAKFVKVNPDHRWAYIDEIMGKNREICGLQ